MQKWSEVSLPHTTRIFKEDSGRMFHLLHSHRTPYQFVSIFFLLAFPWLRRRRGGCTARLTGPRHQLLRRSLADRHTGLFLMCTDRVDVCKCVFIYFIFHCPLQFATLRWLVFCASLTPLPRFSLVFCTQVPLCVGMEVWGSSTSHNIYRGLGLWRVFHTLCVHLFSQWQHWGTGYTSFCYFERCITGAHLVSWYCTDTGCP